MQTVAERKKHNKLYKKKGAFFSWGLVWSGCFSNGSKNHFVALFIVSVLKKMSKNICYFVNLAILFLANVHSLLLFAGSMRAVRYAYEGQRTDRGMWEALAQGRSDSGVRSTPTLAVRSGEQLSPGAWRGAQPNSLNSFQYSISGELQYALIDTGHHRLRICATKIMWGGE